MADGGTRVKLLTLGAIAAALVLGLNPGLSAREGGPQRDGASRDSAGADAPVQYSAVAVRTTADPAQTIPVTIDVQRWSTDAERDTLITALRENGADKLLDTLKKLPSVGRLSGTGTVGYDIRFARRAPQASGGARVVLATDRWISFPEAATGGRSLDYPFTIIELTLGPDGKGQGTMSFATQISWNERLNLLTLENYESQPIKLQGVTRID